MSQMEGIFKDSNVLADYVVDYCASVLYRPLTNLQLQKVLFFIEYFYYYKNSEFLFEENFEAWQYGPVLKSVYEKQRKKGAMFLTSSKNIEQDPLQRGSKPNSSTFPKKATENIEFINELVCIVSGVGTFRLVDESHKAGGAWEKARSKGNVIDKNDIVTDVTERRYFKKG